MLVFFLAPPVYSAPPPEGSQQNLPGKSQAVSSSPPSTTSPGKLIPDQDAIDPTTRNLAGDDERLRPTAPNQFRVGDALLTFTGAFRFDVEYQDNFNLRSAVTRDRIEILPLLNLNFIVDFRKGISLFTEFRLENELRLEEMHRPTNTFQSQVRSFYLRIPVPIAIPTLLKIGRQQLFEPRRWILNERQDALHVLLDLDSFELSFSVSTPVFETDQRIQVFDNLFLERHQSDVMLSAMYGFTKGSKLGGYVIVGSKHENLLVMGRPRNEDPVWFGFRILGKEKFSKKNAWRGFDFFHGMFKPKIEYWVDAALVTGSVGTNTISGIGLDVGATYIARKFPFNPSVTLAYAFASGDSNPTDGVDRNFRQTGFQNNSGKLGGVVNFEYYGVAVDLELSNLHVYTAGIGIRPSKKSSINLVYHHIEQDQAFNRLRDSKVANPAGLNRNIGDEIDVAMGYREIKNVRFRFRNGLFFPGNAYPSGSDDHAFFSRFDVQLSF